MNYVLINKVTFSVTLLAFNKNLLTFILCIETLMFHMAMVRQVGVFSARTVWYFRLIGITTLGFARSGKQWSFSGSMFGFMTCWEIACRHNSSLVGHTV